MNHNKTYWFLQFIGWTLFVFTDMFNYFFIFNFNYNEFEDLIFNALINISLGIVLTNVFRNIFKHNFWIKLSVPALIIRCVVAAFVITALLALVNVSMDNKTINITSSKFILSEINYLITIGKPVLMWILIYIFYSYSEERQYDQIEKIKLQSSVETSEAKILRAQINPHFMFNALNSIRALILEDPKKAQNGITQLSNILRSALVADRKTTISLKEELKTVEDYLTLEKIRYEERLQIKWKVDPKSLTVQVPPMMLQTLVENAIKHGVQKAINWGFVEINTQVENNFILIKIRNTGNLNTTENTQIDGGFGLANTEKRLKILYAKNFNFRIFQESNNIVCAEIKLPIL